MILLSVSTCKFWHVVTFVIRKENLTSFWCMICEWYVLKLVLFNFLKAENTITCNHVLYIKITSSSVFSWQKWQNVEICILIRSVIPNINFFENFTMFLHLWKDWDKISQYYFHWIQIIVRHHENYKNQSMDHHFHHQYNHIFTIIFFHTILNCHPA